MSNLHSKKPTANVAMTERPGPSSEMKKSETYPVSRLACWMIFPRSTFRTRAMRRSVSKVGFRSSRSTKLIIVRESPERCESTFMEMPCRFRASDSSRTTAEQTGFGVQDSGTHNHYKEKVFDRHLTIVHGPTMFKRRIDSPLLCHGGHKCPAVLQMECGDFALIGLDITEEATPELPPDCGCGPNERIVRIPRAVMLQVQGANLGA